MERRGSEGMGTAQHRDRAPPAGRRAQLVKSKTDVSWAAVSEANGASQAGVRSPALGRGGRTQAKHAYVVVYPCSCPST